MGKDQIRGTSSMVYKLASKLTCKRILLSGISATAFAASALAADLPPPAPAPYRPLLPVPVFSWTGCYIGGNLGYGHESRTWNATVTTVFSGPASQRTSGGGFVGGGQLGCDYQFGGLVVGVEGMLDGSTIDKISAVNVVPGATLRDEINWFATATGRVGWSFDQVLLYAKGGAAWEQVGGTINGGALGLATETHNWDNTGWVLGGGLEWAFSPDWSVKVEYDHIGLKDRNAAFPLTTAGTVRFTSQNLQTILVGLNYRFHFGGPPW
jgi:outer membrane immunogenic protein